MPRYFFDVRDAETVSRDEVGLDLPDDDAARAHVGTLLPRAVQRSAPDGLPHAFECSARDDAGTVVYRGELLFRGTPRQALPPTARRRMAKVTSGACIRGPARP